MPSGIVRQGRDCPDAAHRPALHNTRHDGLCDAHAAAGARDIRRIDERTAQLRTDRLIQGSRFGEFGSARVDELRHKVGGEFIEFQDNELSVTHRRHLRYIRARFWLKNIGLNPQPKAGNLDSIAKRARFLGRHGRGQGAGAWRFCPDPNAWMSLKGDLSDSWAVESIPGSVADAV